MKALFALMFALIFPIVAYAEIRLQDNFEYSVTRGQSGASAIFISNGGWTGAKTLTDAPGACGYIYTVTSIPGFRGCFPGTNSNRVLCMEFLPATLKCDVGGGWLQTDCYLNFGGAASPANYIPSDVWIQFWIYPQRYGNQLSRFHNLKWLYPSKTGNYPARTTTGLDWLVMIRENSYLPFWEPNGDGSSCKAGNAYIANMGSYANYNVDRDNAWKLGHNIAQNAGLLRSNTWTLVKIHLDTRGPQGVYEQWHKTVSGSFVKVMDWRGNVTRNFTWPIANAKGHKALRLGTTVDGYDAWIYLDDFVIATSEADLPTYAGQGSSPPPATNMRKIR